jgi:hypothetical protein
MEGPSKQIGSISLLDQHYWELKYIILACITEYSYIVARLVTMQISHCTGNKVTKYQLSNTSYHHFPMSLCMTALAMHDLMLSLTKPIILMDLIMQIKVLCVVWPR